MFMCPDIVGNPLVDDADDLPVPAELAKIVRIDRFNSGFD